MPRKKKRSPNLDPIHQRVGQRLRKRRLELGMTQARLSRALRISYQRFQKYEHGTTRISAGMLWIIADVLGVEVSYFFEDLDPRQAKTLVAAEPMAEEDGVSPSARETLELVKGYQALRDARVRKTVRNVVSAFARSSRNARYRKRALGAGRSGSDS